MRRFALLMLLLIAFESHGATARFGPGPSVIIIGGGMSGISAGKALSEAGIDNLLILEATERIGGRIRKTEFAGVNVEIGASWIEGVNGQEVNPIWTLARKLKLRTAFSDFQNISANVYQQANGRYDASIVQTALDRADNVSEAGAKFSEVLPSSGLEDISVLTFQRLQKHVPTTALDMAIDYYNFDGEFAEPPRVTSLQNTEPLPTFVNFGEDIYQVSDQRGYESVVRELARQFLDFDANGTITDPRLKLNKVVSRVEHSRRSGVIVQTEDGSTYKSDYLMVSASIGVLQSDLIKFEPDLPEWKILAIYQFSMAVYTKIFLEFPSRFWPSGNGTEFFLYASDRRGYYPIWQHMDDHYPGSNILLVTVTDEESRRIEQQPDSATKAEAMAVLKNIFGEGIPEATEILVPKWWSSRLYRGTFSNWPIGVGRYEFDQIRAPVGRVYFTGEHTSEAYNGYVHGAYLAGIDSAMMMVGCIKYGSCDVQIDTKA